MKSEKQQKDVCILVIGSSQDEIDDIEEKLLQMAGFSCRVWHCYDLSEAIFMLRSSSSGIDVVLLDFHMICASSPQETFQSMLDVSFDLPIIVFSDYAGSDLALFLIEEGAADTITKNQTDSDPYKLRCVIENSLARNKAFQKKHEREIDNLIKEKETILRKANGNRARALNALKEESMRKIKERDQIILWMSGGYSVEDNIEHSR